MMAWRFRVLHRTGFHYETVVHASYNEARLTPLATPTQFVIDHRVDVIPGAQLFAYRDYWGTEVHVFDIHMPHRELHVTGDSVVETSPDPLLGEPAGISWDELTSPDVTDAWCEYLAPTAYTIADDAIIEEIDLIKASTEPHEAVETAGEWVRDRLAYQKGSTTVHTTAAEALRAREGVCQDFVHLAIAALRAMGIPARYSSGYLHPHTEPEVGATVAGESHAWLEAWIGRWCAIDPTNGSDVGPRHVLVARGRDYADVPPLKGVLHGGRARELEVEVSLARLA